MSGLLNFLDIRRLPKEKQRYFAFNICFGIMLMLVSLAFMDTAMYQSLINGRFDKFIKLNLNHGGDIDTKQVADELVFLDFDKDSLQVLGRSAAIPRDKIADLARIAYRQRAQIIVLDMRLSEADYTPGRSLYKGEPRLTGWERDQVLLDLLRQIRDDADSPTKVLLPVEVYADGTQKRSEFVDLIDNKKIFAVTPVFSSNERVDHKARFWLPYAELKTRDGTPGILWSIPLLSFALAHDCYDELSRMERDVLEGNGEAFSLGGSSENPRDKFTFYRERTEAGGSRRDTQSLQYNRIQYVLLPPYTRKDDPTTTISEDHIGHWRPEGLNNDQIQCADKIVIIGRNDPDCGDFHSTPVADKLSGMYIHGNSVATVLGKTQPHLTSVFKHVAIELFLIVVTSYTFLYTSPFKAKCLVGVMTLLCFPLAYFYFRFTNEFVYQSFSFTGIGVYNLLTKLEAFFKDGFSIKNL